MNVSSRARFRFLTLILLLVSCLCATAPVWAQSRFDLRAEPDVIAANGTSTTSIFVQVPDSSRNAIQASQMVHFATTAGVIESQAQLAGGVARVLLRSSTTPGTAVVTAFVGNSREAITVEFSEDNGMAQRYLEVSAPYVAYGATASQITASGKTGLDFGDTHIESDVRLDVDLATERIWAQGTKGSVLIRHGHGAKARELRGDRLFYDLRRNRGVMRRADNNDTDQPARQEFVGSEFAAPPSVDPVLDTPSSVTPGAPGTADAKPPLSPSPTKQLEGDDNRGSSFVVPPPPITAAPSDKGADTAAVAPPALVGTPDQTPAEAAAAPKLETAIPQATAPETAAPTADAKAPVDEKMPATQFGDLSAELNATKRPSTVVPGSLADTPKAPEGSEARVTSLVNAPPAAGNDGDLKNGAPPAYAPLPADSGTAPRIVELPPPTLDTSRGYWVASRRLRVFPRDKVQFEKASIYFNGKKAFGVPLYVLPLDGSFNPTTDMFAFNSQGGVSLKFPFYYQATKTGTGALYVKRDPGDGFSTQDSGMSLALDQQYWLSPRSHGKFSVDQIGHGDWNLNYEHEMQFSPNTTGAFYLNMPRHRDMFARASLAKDLKSMQIGFEGFYDNAQDTDSNLRGQFYARSRPKTVGKTGWSYTFGANALAVRRGYNTSVTVGGGGVGIPGGDGSIAHTITTTHPLIGQTLTASMQSPVYSPWRGGNFNANLMATAFNYSNGRRGAAPGVTMGFGQTLGSVDMRIDYTYDRSNLGLYGLTTEAFTNYVSGSVSARLTKKIGLSTFASKSLQDGSLYGSADLDYSISRLWRVGLFSDYSNFTDVDSLLNYGWSVGRMVGQREVSVNYDQTRGKVYLELGNSRY